MPLDAGARFGPYEIVGPLGAGAMGEVYRARDDRLERDVALKVLAVRLATDVEALGRFEREARAIAAISHPNILAIHDVGRQADVAYAVMELLAGETLRERLDGGQISVRKSIDVAAQIARGLAAAHARGIVHRDLKPENVFLTSEGAVKILDFGIARALSPALAGAGDGTTGVLSTEPGTILGTVGYMAPEQVRGVPSDGRADIFALGCLLFEMITGRRAFQRDTAAETMTAILREQPPEIPASGQHVPPALERIVQRCLEKVPEERFQSARDLAFALDALTSIAGTGEARPAFPWSARPARRAWRGAFLVLSLALAVAAGAFGALYLGATRGAPEPTAVIRAGVPVPDGINVIDERCAIAISRDGRRLAVRSGGRFGPLIVRDVGSFETRVLTGTEGSGSPFFSPDGQWLGFFQGAALRKVSLRDGSIFTLLPRAGADRGAAWTDDGFIVFAGIRSGLMRVSAEGGEAAAITELDTDRGEFSHRWPFLIPAHQVVLYVAARRGLTSFDDADIVARSLVDGRTRVVARGTTPRFLPGGHLVYVRNGTMLGVPFDPRTLETSGAAVPLIQGIDWLPTSGAAHVVLADNGWLAYVAGDGGGLDTDVVWVDRHGRVSTAIPQVRPFAMPRLSPDGSRIAFVQGGPENSVWVADPSRGVLSRLSETYDAIGPAWTPDGRQIATSTAMPVPGVWVGPFLKLVAQPSDGSAPPTRVLPPVGVGDQSVEVAGEWTPDGRTLVYTRFGSDGNADIMSWTVGGEPRPWLQTPAHEAFPALSPDGAWVAYGSNESGQNEIYVRPLGGSGVKVQVSVGGGQDPAWVAGGRELYYRRENDVFVVPIAFGQERPSAGQPVRVIAGGYTLGEFGRGFDVSRDGRRLLMLRPHRPAFPTQVNLVLNWLVEARQKLAP